MNVKSVEQENGKAKIVVEIDKAAFEAAINTVFQKNKKSIMVPGFRKGKASRMVVEGMYGSQVFHEDAINEMFPDVYTAAVVDQKIKAVGMPNVTNMEYAEDGGVILTVETELFPEVVLGDYKGLEVVKGDVVVEATEVDAELAKMAERNARIETVERPIADGDTVVFDFEGFDNGVPFEGGKADGHSLKIGSGQFVPGFEEALIGLSAGDEKDIDITFPENYTPELAGKPVVFKCKIHEVKETTTPVLDDEFAKDVSEFDTLEALKEDILAGLVKTRQEAMDKDFENNAIGAAVANMTVTVPSAMIEEQVDKQLEQFSYQLQASGMTMEDYAKMMGGDMSAMRTNMRPMAENTVKTNLMLAQIAETEGFTVSDEEIEAEYEAIAKQYEMELDKVKGLLTEDSLKSDMVSKKAVTIITESAVAITPAEGEAKAEAAAKPAPKKRAPRKKKEVAPVEEAPVEE
ncbi:MAG: trigger factor [Eubacteriales bacterium]